MSDHRPSYNHSLPAKKRRSNRPSSQRGLQQDDLQCGHCLEFAFTASGSVRFKIREKFQTDPQQKRPRNLISSSRWAGTASSAFEGLSRSAGQGTPSQVAAREFTKQAVGRLRATCRLSMMSWHTLRPGAQAMIAEVAMGAHVIIVTCAYRRLL
ncbi:hypothetical protein FALCPG4_19032 [Fusarium falciforme]